MNLEPWLKEDQNCHTCRWLESVKERVEQCKAFPMGSPVQGVICTDLPKAIEMIDMLHKTLFRYYPVLQAAGGCRRTGDHDDRTLCDAFCNDYGKQARITQEACEKIASEN